MLSTDQQGAIAELAIATRAAQLGIGVWSAHTIERYDLIFDLRPKLVRVQCKWATRYGDVLIVRC
jgi:PD-(D/E)XK endonuclease